MAKPILKYYVHLLVYIVSVDFKNKRVQVKTGDGQLFTCHIADLTHKPCTNCIQCNPDNYRVLL